MPASRRYNRRRFLATSAAAASALAFPAFVPERAFGANERVNTGHIGLGGQGGGNLRKFINQAVALCDVDSSRLAKALKSTEGAGRMCEGYGDYRKILDRKDVDAVVISTPDHWHALPTIHACQAGKDVYCEKPLSLNIEEGRKMVAAARENNRIVQTGSQQRSAANFRQACELVRNGKLGQIKQVLVGIPGPNHPGEPKPDSTPPAELDYNFWLGPARLRPYNEKRVHYNFRFFWDYSGGQMTNWGAHHIDIAQWGLGMDDSGPLRVWGEATFHDKRWHEVTETCRLHYEYAGGIELIVGQGQKDIPPGTTFIGSEGEIFVNRGKLSSKPDDVIEQPLAEGAVRLYASTDHHKNFLDCIKSRELPICDVEIGHRSATVCHLGNIVARTGEEIRWDPVKEALTGSEQAQALCQHKYRAPWTLS
jgi:predicted dehydrogenase